MVSIAIPDISDATIVQFLKMLFKITKQTKLCRTEGLEMLSNQRFILFDTLFKNMFVQI